MSWTRPKYQITEDSRLVYILDTELDGLTKEYTVWGICEKGFLHGVGTYIKRDSLGIKYTIIDKPTKQEFERYYRLLEEHQKRMEEQTTNEEDLKKFLDDGTREQGDEWKDLLDDNDIT